MWVNHWSWSSCRCSGWSRSRGRSARAAACWSSVASGCTARICTASITSALLVLENLGEQTASEMFLQPATAIAARSSSAWIASSDFCSAAWSAWSGSDFRAAARTCTARCNLCATRWSSLLRMQACKFALQLALHAFEGIQDWSANVAASVGSWSASFNSAAWSAWSSDFSAAGRTCVACTCTWSSDFSAAAWASSAWSHFSSTRRISYRGVTARAGSTAAFSAEQTAQ